MKRSLYEQEQARKVKTRFRMLQHAQKISHDVSQTCRFFGISRAQYYIWLRRFEKNGMEGLRDRSRRRRLLRPSRLGAAQATKARRRGVEPC